MELTEEFLEGKNFVYIDFSKKNKNDIIKSVEVMKSVIVKYPLSSIYTITNIAGVKFDSELKEILVDFVSHNKPYVKYGAVIGADGIKKITVNSLLKNTDRTNILFAFSKEQAIELLMKQK